MLILVSIRLKGRVLKTVTQDIHANMLPGCCFRNATRQAFVTVDYYVGVEALG